MSKKEAKNDSAKKGLYIVAPNVYTDRFPEDISKLEIEKPQLREP